ncbi:MAG: discoidin domain-containing protein [Armatimonadetes bacterium]|nr:discoidin domain-containing protein [Armatimonadota bacterium]
MVRSRQWFATSRLTVVATLVLVGVLAASCAQAQQGEQTTLSALRAGFERPPDSAKPHTWWHWMNGMITAKGITKDLQEMKKVGLGGAQIFNVTDGIPPGPVKFMSPTWRSLVKHAVEEAHRQGLELCIHNCAGWSSSGGPWVTPAQAMQMVVWTETQVQGPRHLSQQLKQPMTRRGYYRDIAVLAYPSPAPSSPSMYEALAKVTASQPGVKADQAVDGDWGTRVVLAPVGRDEPAYLQLEMKEPFTARAVTVVPGGGRNGQPCELQVSDDGAKFRGVKQFRIPGAELTLTAATVNFPAVNAKYYRLVFGRSGGTYRNVSLGEVQLHPESRVEGWPAKAAYVRGNRILPQVGGEEVPRQMVLDSSGMVDLTTHMSASGELEWDVPAGRWTILRIGYTPTGKENHPAPDSGRGLECDKMSREAVKAHFDAMMGKIIADVGPLAGTTLKDVLIDSYEVHCQNWTPRFREEFRARRGYDPLKYLPAIMGHIVDSREKTERFLWDFRRTIADLFADNYFGYFAELAHEHGMIFSTEAYGNGPFDNLQCGGRADIPMSEFWAGSGNDNSGSKQAASSAHTWGKKYVGAESFTASAQNGGWRNYPYRLKPLGDLIYCGGVNRFIFHRYAHQPWLNLRPGMTMGPHGFHFDWPITWWKQAPAWLSYLTRCQYLLQSGLFVADLLYFNGESGPNGLPGRGGLRPRPPEGYDYDGCDREVLLQRVSVRDGRLVLPDGMSYAVLVLPPERWMTPAVAAKVAELVQAGATVVGPPPLRSPSLQNYPDCDGQVQAIAQKVWGDCDGQKIKEHRYGKGKVVWGRPLEEVLAEKGLQPDFELHGMPTGASLHYIHRRVGRTDVYFVANQARRSIVVEAVFRVSGRAPELWHPDTGRIERVALYRQEKGRTVVPLRFDPAGSVFVVFPPTPAGRHLVSAECKGRSILQPLVVHVPKLEIRRAVYGLLTAELPGAVDVTQQLARMVRDNKLTVRADNGIAGDPASGVVKTLAVQYQLDGRPYEVRVTEGQTLTLPPKGKKGKLLILRAVYGDLPAGPLPGPKKQVVDVTKQVRALVRDNTVSVVASNALAGDPAPNIVKQMRVDYLLDGHPYTKIVRENQLLVLPDGTEAGFEVPDLPAATVELDRADSAILTAWSPGEFALRTDAGKTLKVHVAQTGETREVKGPWEVHFPSGWGAPTSAVFPKLISWTEHSNPGIKYFSGTAEYRREVEIPAQWLGRDAAVYLGLGRVKVIAQVWVNGQDLGIVWKPPFRVEITRVARAGRNDVSVQVTNLWPNRLIGDEQLPPDDRQWRGAALAAWPKWLLEGKPRPKTPRFTWTTWRHYDKNSPLLESGLLGPVTLRHVVRRTVELGK